MKYTVTAVVQDNQENTMKVCTVCDDWSQAIDKVIEEICIQGQRSRETVLETWMVLFMSCEPTYEEHQR